jgi:signal transduction histidine kinase
MTSFSFSSLRVRLMLLVLLAVIPILGLMVYTASEDRQREKTKVEGNALQLARLASGNQERLIEEGRHLLIGLARLPEVRSRNADACSKLFADLLKQFPRYANLGAADPNGNVFCSAVPLRRPMSLRDFLGVEQAIQTREFTVGTYHIGAIVGKAILPLTYPALDKSGRIEVLMFATLDLAWLSQFADDAKLPLGSTLTMIDRNGMILIRHPDPEKWVGKSMLESPLIKTILSQQTEGTAEIVGLDKLPRLYAFMPLRGETKADAYLAIGIPAKVAFAEVNRIFTRNLIWLGLVIFLLLAAAWIFGDIFILRQVNRLLRMIQRLSTGDLTARSGGLRYRGGELNQLSKAFDQMAEALQQYAERLKIQYQIDHAILVAQSPDEIAKSTLDHIWKMLPCARASVVIFNLETSEAKVLAVHVNGQTSLGTGAPIPLEIFGDIEELRQGKVHTVGDIRTLSELTPATQALQTDGVRSYINVPLVSRGKLIGLLNLGLDRPGTFAEEYVEIARGVADSLAVAIQQALLFKSVSEHRKQLRALTARLTEVEEAERQRLARELHDRVGQNLTALDINLNILRSQLPVETTAKVEERLGDSQRLVAEIAEDIRNVMADLRPPLLDEMGLSAALRWYSEQFSNRTGIVVLVRGEEMTPRLPPAVEMAFFRIGQEALTNVAKHAQAGKVALTLEGVGGGVRLIIADDGVGFDPTAIQQGEEQRWGIMTMQERAEAVGGNLRIESKPGNGTRIIVEIRN